MNVEQVKSCYTSEEGYQMMLKAEIETKNMTPGPLFVPTIVFDDVRNYFNNFRLYTNIFILHTFTNRFYIHVLRFSLEIQPRRSKQRVCKL